ncbi:MAG: hypothetical protein N2484_12360 [Clostridia bacterium]|nr:hypothetical protein [Clostridia bacterium]
MDSMKQLSPVPLSARQVGKNKKNKKANQVAVSEIYLDGKLKKADLIDEGEKSYGIFMHSLILSNYAEVMKISSEEASIIGDEYEKAIFQFTTSKGFDKNLIESIAPKVDELTFGTGDRINVSTHLINEKMRIISKGTPEKLLRRCSYILLDSRFVKITRKVYKEVSSVLFEMLIRCQNVYAIAIKDITQNAPLANQDHYVSDMTLVAFVGLDRMNLQPSLG